MTNRAGGYQYYPYHSSLKKAYFGALNEALEGYCFLYVCMRLALFYCRFVAIDVRWMVPLCGGVYSF